MKLAILIRNPIHYFVPLYRRLGNVPGIDMTVYYTSKLNVSSEIDHGFMKRVDWGSNEDLLSGYKYVFLDKLFTRAKHGTFWGHANPGIIKEMFVLKPDAIIIHGYAYLTSWLVLVCAKCLGTKILFKGEVNALERKPLSKQIFRWPALKLIFSMVNDFLAIGTLNKQYYRSFGVPEKKITMVPFCIDNDMFIRNYVKLQQQKDRMRERFRIKPDSRVLLSTGKLIPRKRQRDMIEAICELNAEGTQQYHIIFVGDGPDKETLIQLAAQKNVADRMIITGFIKQDTISEYYIMADIFVLCSSKETWGLVCNEAMCHCLPIIASDQIGCSVDLIKEGVNGFTYPVGDINLLKQKISQVNEMIDKGHTPGLKSIEIIKLWGYDQAIDGMKKSLNKLGFNEVKT